MRQHQCERSWLNWGMSHVKEEKEGIRQGMNINLFAAFWLWHSLLLLFYILCITWTTTATRCSCHCVFHIPFPFPFLSGACAFPLSPFCLWHCRRLSVFLSFLFCFLYIFASALALFACCSLKLIMPLRTQTDMCVCVCMFDVAKVSARLSQAAQLNAQCSRRYSSSCCRYRYGYFCRYVTQSRISF